MPDYTATGTQSVTFEKSDITLYAVWAENSFNIDGTVEEENGGPVSGAQVKLMRASTQYGDVYTTQADGKFQFTNIKPGSYNVVVEKDEKIVTRYIMVVDQDITVGTITLPIGIKNSILRVEANTPDVVVAGLDTLFASTYVTDETKGFTEAENNIVRAGGTAEFILRCTGKEEGNLTEEEKKAVEAIRQAAAADGREIGLLIDFSLDKVITPAGGSPNTIAQTETAANIGLHIFLPQELQGEDGYAIYRYHGAAEELTDTPNDKGERFDGINEEEMTANFEAGRFSLYAVAYRPQAAGGGNTHTDSGSGTSTSQEQQPDMEVLEDVPALDITEEMQPDTTEVVPVTGEPQTGDNRIPVMPVAAGAVTVFMLKIMLWLYELEFGITQEQKDEVVKELTDWARGRGRLRIYAAIAAMTVVLVCYHLSKRLKCGYKRMVKKEID